MIQSLLFLMYLIGFAVFVLLEAQNSIKSPTNGVSEIGHYLKLQGVKLFARFFFTVILYVPVVALTQKAVAAVGFTLPIWALAGGAGYASSGFVRQITGLIPVFRAEISEAAPPSDSK